MKTGETAVCLREPYNFKLVMLNLVSMCESNPKTKQSLFTALCRT